MVETIPSRVYKSRAIINSARFQSADISHASKNITSPDQKILRGRDRLHLLNIDYRK